MTSTAMLTMSWSSRRRPTPSFPPVPACCWCSTWAAGDFMRFSIPNRIFSNLRTMERMHMFGDDLLTRPDAGGRRSRRSVHDRHDLRAALSSRVEGEGVRAHRHGRPEGDQGRRGGGAAGLPRDHPRQHEHPEARGDAQQGREPHHQGPHAGRHRRGVLRAGDAERGGDRERGADARPAHARSGGAAGAGRGQVRRCAALDRGDHDDAAAAGPAAGIRAGRAERGERGPDQERPRAGKRLAHQPRPDRQGVLQSPTTPSTPRG